MSAPARSQRFTRSVAVLASGTAIGQLLLVAGAPLIARLYTPAQVGTFGVYLAVVSILSVISTLRYDAAIPLAESDGAARELFHLAVGLALFVAAVLAIVIGIAVGPGHVGDLKSDNALIALLVPASLFLAAIQQTLTYWTTRMEAFGASGRSSVAAGVGQTGAQLGFGYLGFGAVGLTLGYIVGRIAAIALLLRTFVTAPAASAASWTGLRIVARRHRRFPLFSLWSALFNTASVQAPVLLLAALFDDIVVGWFALTVRVLQLPSSVLGTAVAQVFYARVGRAANRDVAETTALVGQALLTLGLGPTILLTIVGDRGFQLIFGGSWQEAGRYAQWLAPWVLLVFVSSPLSTLIYVKDRQGTELLFQAFLLGARLLVLVIGARLGDGLIAVSLYGVCSAALWGAYLIWLLRISGVPLSKFGRQGARQLLISIVLSVPVTVATIGGVADPLWVLIGAATLAVMLIRALLSIRSSATTL